MKIAVVSKSTSEGGGASRIAQELVASLRQQGEEATHWRAWGPLPGPEHSEPLYGESDKVRKGLKALRFINAKLGWQEMLPWELPAIKNSGLMDADIIHIHDITFALSPATLRWLAARKPVLWTFHDTSPITGGCINPLDCTEYLRACSGCPQKRSWPICGVMPMPGMQLKQKRWVGQVPFWVTTPSQWLADLVTDSHCYDKANRRVLSNGIDTRIFVPGDRAALRAQLGLDPHKLTLVISAGNLTDTRKGIPDALAVVREVGAQVPVQVIAVGRENPALAEALPGIPVRATGYLQSPHLLALSYAAGDALVYCSIADNQPLTILENMATGNATYTYAIGGIPEIVGPDTGLVVPAQEVQQLSSAIVRDWRSGALKQKGEAAHQLALSDYSLDTMTHEFLAVYREMLSSARKE